MIRRILRLLIVWAMTTVEQCHNCRGKGDVWADVHPHTGTNYTNRREKCPFCDGRGTFTRRPLR